MDAAGASETQVYMYQITRHAMPKVYHLKTEWSGGDPFEEEMRTAGIRHGDRATCWTTKESGFDSQSRHEFFQCPDWFLGQCS